MVEKQLALYTEAINAEIEKYCGDADADFAPVLDAMKYSLVAPRAKRIRPVLTLAFCRLFGGKDEAALAAGVALEDCGTDFEKAVAAAVRNACTGDTVMLSPGCASMDMFKNYQERGEEFKKAVRKMF